METRTLELKAEVLKALAQPTRLKDPRAASGAERGASARSSQPSAGSSPTSPAISP